jgi:hypothetical protein
MPVQGAGHPPPDFVDRRRGFCVKLVKVHIRPLYCGWPGRAADQPCWAIVGADMVNGPLMAETAAGIGPIWRKRT